MLKIALDQENLLPRWIREFNRFLKVKNLLLVYGNIYDRTAFPLIDTETAAITWTSGNLLNFFLRLFEDLGYEIVGSVDPIEPLHFSKDSMSAQFKKVSATTTKESPQTPSNRDESGDSMPAHVETIDSISRALKNKEAPCAFVVNLASRFLCSPDQLQPAERDFFTRILKASLRGDEVIRFQQKQRWNNILVLICDKINDLPTFLYLNNPRARSVHIETPDREERRRFISQYYPSFFGAGTTQEPPPAGISEEFAALTEGLSFCELGSLATLSHKEAAPIRDPQTGHSRVRNLVERYKYGVMESEWDKIEYAALGAAEQEIKKRIRGQDHAVNRALDIVKKARVGLSAGQNRRSNRPRGVLFFAGPTGTGKTEVAKMLAHSLFGQEERLIRFDMTEYGEPNSDQRLMGSPPGYVGYEEGGQLTNAVKKNPFSVILFDEIEKAHGSIFDKFMQVLDDGRLTDGKGETVYFSEAVIIFTSNLGIVERPRPGVFSENRGRMLVTSNDSYQKIQETMLAEIKAFFNFELRRPEILNRFGDNFVVFDFIRPQFGEEILDIMLANFIRQSRENARLELSIAPEVRKTLLELALEKLDSGGGRWIRNLVDDAVATPICRKLFDQRAGITQNDESDGSPQKVHLARLIANPPDSPDRYEIDLEFV
jgi:hypothetical protein